MAGAVLARPPAAGSFPPDLAEYHIPVCADTPPVIDVSALGLPDAHMPQIGFLQGRHFAVNSSRRDAA